MGILLHHSQPVFMSASYSEADIVVYMHVLPLWPKSGRRPEPPFSIIQYGGCYLVNIRRSTLRITSVHAHAMCFHDVAMSYPTARS